jgi:RNA polymerase primary sigma factor
MRDGLGAEQMDPEGSDAEDDPLGRLVALAINWAEDGRLDKTLLESLLDEVDLPADDYRAALGALEAAGVRVIDSPERWTESRDKDEPGPPVDGFGAFLRRTEHDILSFEEEQALGVRMEQGQLAASALALHPDLDAGTSREFRRRVCDGKVAADELVSHNLRLVHSIAKLFSSFESPGLDREDLIQEGWTGLAHAVEKWDYHRGLKFSTYATWWIRQVMSRAVADKGSSVRLPVHSREALNHILGIEARLLARGDHPTIQQLAAECEMPEEKVRQLLSWRNRLTSLDRLTELGAPDIDRDRSFEDEPEHFAELALLVDRIHGALDQLPVRQAEVIRMRFGLEGRPRQTLEEIGELLGVTRERVRQIEVRALKKLKLSTPQLESYAEE